MAFYSHAQIKRILAYLEAVCAFRAETVKITNEHETLAAELQTEGLTAAGPAQG